MQDILSTLIAFDTTSRYSNLALIAWVEGYLQQFGLISRLTYSDDGAKANLYCGIGDDSLPVIILSGHTDVVPVDGQVWQTAPFELSEKEGKLFGRGTCDMKGFIACVLAQVPEWQRLSQAGLLQRRIGIALSYDEEVGCLGVGRLIADLLHSGEQIEGCIIGEPTNMRPVIAHKGIAHFRCKVSGRAAHSSLTPDGVNAIEYAARLILHIRRLAEAEQSFGTRHPLYDVPFTTLQTGVVKGGTAANIVPKDCEFIFECRWLPGDHYQRFLGSVQDYAANLLSEMRQTAPEADIVFESLVDCPPFESDPQSSIRQHVESLCACGDRDAVAYTTEAGRFAAAGIPAIVCGPGSIEQAHRPDEFISLDQLQHCMAWLARLTLRLQV